MIPKLNLPNDCDAGQYLAGAFINMVAGFLVAVLVGFAVACMSFVAALFPLIAMFYFAVSAYCQVVRLAHSLQVYYLWRRNNEQ